MRVVLLVAAFALLDLCVVPARGGPPDGYVLRDGWFDTLLASREALLQRQRESRGAAKVPDFTSEVVRGGEPARRIRVPLAGARQVLLLVTGAPDVVGGAATWADIRAVAADGKEVRLCHLRSLEVLDGRHDIDCNLKSGVSGPLSIAGRRFEHGIHVYAPSKVRLRLDQDYAYLEAWIGIDDWVGRRGQVRFHVAGSAAAARWDLWPQLQLDFSGAAARQQIGWEREDGIMDEDWSPNDLVELARRYAAASQRVPELADRAAQLAPQVSDRQSLEEVRRIYHRSRQLAAGLARARSLNLQGLQRAIEDLQQTHGSRYPRGAVYLQRLSELREQLDRALPVDAVERSSDLERIESLVREFERLQRDALTANPALDFDRLLLIRRVPHGDPRRSHDRGYGVGEYIGLPRQSSKCNPGIEQPLAWDNEIAVLSPVAPEGRLSTLYKPEGNRLLTDVDLHWDADRLLFSMPGSLDDWHVFEIRNDGSGLRQLTPDDQPGIHFYDPCYLPNGDIALVSTAPLQGVPCNAGVIVGMMYMMDADGGNLRQVCFEQDHTYCPAVLNDGRILYLRWDYTDTPHVWNRVLFSMNPDGTNQAEFYGSNSYWPNSIFYARPIPNHPTQVVGIVTGHHVGRVGELVVFDPARGRHEVEGVVQRIPGYGRPVEALIEDKLTEHSWPKFVHPYPLSAKHFLVACKPAPDSLWGIYLVDTFDNMVLLHEEEGHVLLEPLPWRAVKRPPVIAGRVDPEQSEATVYLADVYAGPGLAGVPRGAVKQLRVFTYHFGYQRLAGIDHRVGADGPWEVKRVLGTVPVQEDGSALFRVPAKTPISVQPLDAEGQALALMRSWMTAMPGETLSCVGCHEQRNTSPPSMNTLAATRRPARIRPWYGPTRGFSFQREVQPVLDRFCVGCHNGTLAEGGHEAVDLRGEGNGLFAYRHGDPQLQSFAGVSVEELKSNYRGIFPASYVALRRLVRVGGLESDLHLLPPLEFHAGTTELLQMLRKGHHGVALDAEAWDRLITWIDLNAPCHGAWSEFTQIPGDQRQRRMQLQQLYGGIVQDCEQPPPGETQRVEAIVPPPVPRLEPRPIPCEGWPLEAAAAARCQQSLDGPVTRTIDLGEGIMLDLVRVPAGRFVMGDWHGHADEQPPSEVAIERPFWIGRTEVTNRQFACFDPKHDSRFEHRSSWIFSEEYLGWPLNRTEQPVVRVSWSRAMEFCRWLSRRTGLQVTLPSEAEWEYACRAGSATPFWYGDADTDFAHRANLADRQIRDLAYEGWRPRSPDLVPRDERFDDGHLVTADAGSYAANPWGLHDMHGNVWEWTRSLYRPYPWDAHDGRDAADAEGDRVVRGGSWYDRPERARSSFRLAYAPYQRVFNVGFRVVCSDAAAAERGASE